MRSVLMFVCFFGFAQPGVSTDSLLTTSVQYARASIFVGLPNDVAPMVESVLDNRLSTSSWRTVEAGMKIWREVADYRSWGVIIPTDDPN